MKLGSSDVLNLKTSKYDGRKRLPVRSHLSAVPTAQVDADRPYS